MVARMISPNTGRYRVGLLAMAANEEEMPWILKV
jgi:hypothetical protein